MEKLIESQKPEVPLVVDGGMGVGGGGGGTAFNSTRTSVTLEEMRLSLNDRTGPNVSPSVESSLGLTFNIPAFSFDARFNGAGLDPLHCEFRVKTKDSIRVTVTEPRSTL